MSKYIKKAVLAVASLFLILAVSSCSDPVFYGIMHDVAPEEATINGNITSIARCKIGSTEYLFLTTGGTLFYKPVTSSKHGEWVSFDSLPFEAHHYDYYSEEHIGNLMLRVVSDEDYIYILSSDFDTDTQYGIVLPDTFSIWAKPLANFFTNTSGTNKGWTNITAGQEDTFFKTVYNSSEGLFETYFSIFSTNAVIPGHRAAFFKVQTPGTSDVTYYNLNGTSAPSANSSVMTNAIKVNSGSTGVNSAFYVGDTLYFTDSLVVSTNETPGENASIACLAGVKDRASTDNGYFSSNSLYTFDGSSTSVTKLVDVNSPVASLAFTKDSLLIGEGSYNSTYTDDGGIERILLDSNRKPLNSTSEFTSNAKYQFTSAYIIMTLLCTDPSKTEAETNLYATLSFRGTGSSSTASPKDIGLWSYYPDRGNWNRE